jgi:Fic family protein
MEGIAVTVEEVRRILVGDVPPEVTPENAELVRGYRDAMSFVLRRADDPGFRWDRELVVGLHDRVLAGRSSLGAGRLRTGSAYVVDRRSGQVLFAPPDHELVPELVDSVCATLEEDGAHPALRSAWVHVATAAIHPFKDGNGRTARVLASLAMYRGGFKLPEFTSLEEWWGRHLPDYYAAFEGLGSTFDTATDTTEFVAAHVEAQLHQTRALDMRRQVQVRLFTAAENVVLEAGLPRRMVEGVWDAFFGRDVTSRYYRSLTDVSPATAATDLASAVAAGLLRPVGSGRGRKYFAGLRLHQGIGAALDIITPESEDEARALIITRLGEGVAAQGARRASLYGRR